MVNVVISPLKDAYNAQIDPMNVVLVILIVIISLTTVTVAILILQTAQAVRNILMNVNSVNKTTTKL